MRPFTLRVLLCLAALLPSAPLAQEKGTLELEVGEEKPITGFRPLCDDPSIVTITVAGKGAIKGLKVGETVCSLSVGSPLGQRLVYKVIVREARGDGGGRGGGGGKGRRPAGG